MVGSNGIIAASAPFTSCSWPSNSQYLSPVYFSVWGQEIQDADYLKCIVKLLGYASQGSVNTAIYQLLKISTVVIRHILYMLNVVLTEMYILLALIVNFKCNACKK